MTKYQKYDEPVYIFHKPLYISYSFTIESERLANGDTDMFYDIEIDNVEDDEGNDMSVVIERMRSLNNKAYNEIIKNLALVPDDF